MSTDDTVDEDLEALLYAQVYYGKSNTLITNNENDANLPINDLNIIQTEELPEAVENNRRKFSKRYFANNQNIDSTKVNGLYNIDTVSLSEQDTAGSSPRENIINIQNNYPNQTQSISEIITFLSLSDGYKEFQKKLDSFGKNLPFSRRCKEDYKKLQQGRLSEKRFYNTFRRWLRFKDKAKEIEQEPVLEEPETKEGDSEIVCLSSDSDIEIVDIPESDPHISAITVNKMEKKESDRESDDEIIYISPPSVLEKKESDDESDDEVIYVTPPPVPIITVEESDSDEPNKDVAEETTEAAEDNDEDDFLANESNCSLENFNFGLHGPEFENVDFVKPTDPIDVYETESSTSTSEFRDSNRSFRNTVKTIVFDEVAFPRGEVYSIHNLDKFGEMITPKRPTEPENKSDNAESDILTSNVNQNLPTLTPIDTECTFTVSDRSKRSFDQSEITVTPKSKSKKKKKASKSDKHDESDVMEIDQSWQVEATSTPKTKEKSEEEKKKKKKKHSRNVSAEESPNISLENDTKRSSKKKKKGDKHKSKSSSKNQDLDCNTEETLIYTTNEQSHMEACQEDETLNDYLGDTEESGRKKSKRKKSRILADSSTSSDIQRKEQRSSMSQRENQDKNEAKKIKINEEDLQNSSGNIEEIDNSSKKRNKVKKPRLSESYISTEDNSKNINENTIPNSNKEIQDCEMNEPTATHKDISPIEMIAPSEKSVDAMDATNQDINNEPSISHENPSSNSTNEQNVIEINDNPPEQQDFTKESDSIINLCQTNKQDRPSQVEDLSNSEQVNDDNCIIIDEAPKEIFVINSDSDDDIQTFEGLGDNLQLANTSQSVDEDLKNFDMEVLYSKMTNDPSMWEILPIDKFRSPAYPTGPRCNRCRQRGHVAIKCPNKVTLPSCSLCGHTGHYEPRCPNKLCFSCGNPGNFSTVFCWKCVKNRKVTCRICMIHGHTSKDCPDLWRRYHLTTCDGPVVTPSNQSYIKPRHEFWCSGCASQGHLEFECDSYKWNREYPATSPYVYNYKNIYPAKRVKESRRHSNTTETSSTEQRPPSVDHPSSNVSVEPGQSWQLTPKNKTKSVKKAKINPLSIINNQNQPQSYQPYQSVLNPCSLFNSFAPPTNVFQSVPPASVRNQLESDFIPLDDNQVPDYSVETNPNTVHKNINYKINALEPCMLKKIQSFSLHSMKQFISSELERLYKIDMDARRYKKKIYVIENLNKIAIKNRTIKRQIYHLYKKLNMFLFGISLLCDGKKHLDYLKNFLRYCKSLKPPNKNDVLEAYTYIFGGQHNNFNYKHYLNNVIFRRHKY